MQIILASSDSMQMLVGGLFIAASMLVIFFSFRQRNRAIAAQTWPMVPGYVKQSWIGRRRRQKGPMHYYIGVEYAYRVADKEYTCRRVSFCSSPTYSSEQTAKSTASMRYPEGGNLNVFYNPQKHSDAVLDKKMPNWLAGLIPAIAFATIGTFIMIGKF